jgi:hypothetical protein
MGPRVTVTAKGATAKMASALPRDKAASAGRNLKQNDESWMKS